MALDLSSLAKAISSLERAIVRSRDNPRDEELRDAVIQRFEYTYELCWKMLKRQIELEAANPAEIDALSFRDLLREAAEKGMIDNIEKWFVYREQRNITSHTYDENKAESVKQTAFSFIDDAKNLLNTLEKRSG
ncbi:MAG: nucleotidyltransferase substrate binding protein [Gammaproteobacteria bacterium]|jgi:nucleotidyltransferase substrate binding protein (TIGR01987 family)